MGIQVPTSRLAVISGGAGDIGSAIARELGLAGWDIVLTDIKEISVGRDVALAIHKETGGAVSYEKCDQTDQVQTENLFSQLDADLTIICAATVKAQPFLDIDLELWNEQLELNLSGSFILAQAACRAMINHSKRGHVIFVSSWVAGRAWPDIAAYSVSKAGVEQLMRQIALELAPFGIRANAIAPGIVFAGLAKRQLEEDPAYARRVAGSIPLGGLQDPREIAEAVTFMASSSARNMTGSVLTLDGGCSLGHVD